MDHPDRGVTIDAEVLKCTQDVDESVDSASRVCAQRQGFFCKLADCIDLVLESTVDGPVLGTRKSLGG